MTDFARARSLWFPIKSDDGRTSQRDQQRYSTETNPHRRTIGKILAFALRSQSRRVSHAGFSNIFPSVFHFLFVEFLARSTVCDRASKVKYVLIFFVCVCVCVFSIH